MTDHPTSLRALVEYLRDHPRVVMSCPNPKVNHMGACDFVQSSHGCLWFTQPGGGQGYHQLPVNCGLTAAESGVAFDPDGFRFTKFGTTITVKYQEPTP